MVSRLRINAKPRKVPAQPEGFRGGLEIIRKSVSSLIAHERLEMSENKGFLTRQYTEKLIGDAILYGDKHKHTMEMATWWLQNVSLKGVFSKTFRKTDLDPTYFVNKYFLSSFPIFLFGHFCPLHFIKGEPKTKWVCLFSFQTTNQNNQWTSVWKVLFKWFLVTLDETK